MEEEKSQTSSFETFSFETVKKLVRIKGIIKNPEVPTNFAGLSKRYTDLCKMVSSLDIGKIIRDIRDKQKVKKVLPCLFLNDKESGKLMLDVVQEMLKPNDDGKTNILCVSSSAVRVISKDGDHDSVPLLNSIDFVNNNGIGSGITDRLNKTPGYVAILFNSHDLDFVRWGWPLSDHDNKNKQELAYLPLNSINLNSLDKANRDEFISNLTERIEEIRKMNFSKFDDDSKSDDECGTQYYSDWRK